jgi:C-terminal processing protease CtpA/Prc
MEFVLSVATLILGTGWLFTWRAHKRQENAKAMQEEASAKQVEAEAFKSMQDAYQQMHDDLLKRLAEVCGERDNYKDERDEERRANKEMREKYVELENRMTQMDLQYRKDISRLGRRIDVLSPFLCAVVGCMHRKKVTLTDDIDDNSFATEDERKINDSDN